MEALAASTSPYDPARPSPRSNGCVNDRFRLDACDVGNGSAEVCVNGSDEMLLFRNDNPSWLPVGSLTPRLASRSSLRSDDCGPMRSTSSTLLTRWVESASDGSNPARADNRS